MKSFQLFLLFVGLLATQAHPAFEPTKRKYFPLPTVAEDVDANEDMVEDTIDDPPESLSYAQSSAKVKYWPSEGTGKYVIPFVLDPTARFSDAQVEMLYWAMQSIMRGSNVVFREKQDGDKKWVDIIDNSARKCSSSVGSGLKGARTLRMDPSRCFKIGTVQHEFLHLLGLNHEHKRPDRDDYLVDVDNAEHPKYTTGIVHTPYDFASIVHYTSFRPKDEKFKEVLRLRKVAYSSCDWHAVNTIYRGDKPAPACKPGVATDACEPMPDCTGSDCASVCKKHCEKNFGTLCQFRGGARFPPDAMWELGYTGEEDPSPTPPTGNTEICIPVRAAMEAACGACRGSTVPECDAVRAALTKLRKLEQCRLVDVVC